MPLKKFEIPAHCPKCQSKKFKAVKDAPVMKLEFAGKLANGYRYDRVEWTRKRCECGQALVVRSYQKNEVAKVAKAAR